MAKPIRAITFDLWDTIVADDSDERIRAARGLRGKADERRHLIWQALRAHGPEVPLEQVSLAYDVCDAAFNRLWKRQSLTWTLEERCEVILAGLHRELPEPALAELVERMGRMEVDVPPDLIPGAEETIAALAERYRLAIVSDAVVTPGRHLRQLLDHHGLRRYFSAFAFSDEVGRSKPHPRMFRAIADSLDVRPEEMLHIGDRDHNDIKGAQAFGARAVLFIAQRKVDADHTTADATSKNYRELENAIASLDTAPHGGE